MGAFNASAPPLKFPEALLHGMKPRQPLSALPHTGRSRSGPGSSLGEAGYTSGHYSKTFPGEMQAWGRCGKGAPVPAEAATGCGRLARELRGFPWRFSCSPAVGLDVSGSHPD